VKNKRGFTLIELLIVVVIMMILGALLFPALLNIIDTAKQKRNEALLLIVDGALRIYKGNEGSFPDCTPTGGDNPWEENGYRDSVTLKDGLFPLLDEAEYLEDEFSLRNVDGDVIIDSYESEAYPNGAPSAYVFYKNWSTTAPDDRQTDLLWPKKEGPDLDDDEKVKGSKLYGGFKSEFQLWSLGPDGEYKKFGTFDDPRDEDNVTVTKFAPKASNVDM